MIGNNQDILRNKLMVFNLNTYFKIVLILNHDLSYIKTKYKNLYCLQKGVLHPPNHKMPTKYMIIKLLPSWTNNLS